MIKTIKKMIEKTKVDLFFLVNFNIVEIEEKTENEKTEDEWTAIINIEGVLTPNLSLFGTGYANIITKIKEANQNEKIKNIILKINSPGGSVAGLQKVINEIKKSDKKITTEVDGLCASAAYWIAASTDNIKVTEGSIVGSIGAMIIANKEGSGDFEKIVSKITARKNAGVIEDRKQYEDIVDYETSRFLLDIAKLRKIQYTKISEIADKTGNGKIMNVGEAMRLGLIDSVDETEFIENKKEKNKEVQKMEQKNDSKEIIAQLKKEILDSERKRIQGLAAVFGVSSDFVAAVEGGDDVGSAAVSVLKKIREEAKQETKKTEKEIIAETKKIEEDAADVNGVIIPTASMSVDIPSPEEIIEKIKNKE